MTDYLPTADPLWPLLLILTAAVLLTVLTVWTYRGVQAARGGRLWILLGLRLTALVVACVVLLRPTWKREETIRNPASLVVLVDSSKSMLTTDENKKSRWNAVQEDWKSARDLLETLENELQIRVELKQFDTFENKLRDIHWKEETDWGKPEGNHTAITSSLDESYNPSRYRMYPLLGIILISDGQENDTRDKTGTSSQSRVLTNLGRAGCRVHTLGVGHPSGSELQPDVIMVDSAIQAPEVARVKNRLSVRGKLRTQHFNKRPIRIVLKIDGEPAKRADPPLGDDVYLDLTPDAVIFEKGFTMPDCKLPDTPGEKKLSLEAMPLPDELTPNNNEATTYVTLTKEGLSVLYIEGKYRAWEPKHLKLALKQDLRITTYQAYLFKDSGSEAEQERQRLLEDLEKNAYDVFILGDVPAHRFSAPILDHLEKAVRERGAGLIMIGGQDSFGGDPVLEERLKRKSGWEGNAIMQKMLPVKMIKEQLVYDRDDREKGQFRGEAKAIKFTPTEEGMKHFALRLSANEQENRERWKMLPMLSGGNRLEVEQAAGVGVLAKSQDDELLLAVKHYAKGRTAALATDSMWRWYRPDEDDQERPGRTISENAESYLRFWRQLILWLAQQENTGQDVRIILDHRRMKVGIEQGIRVQAFELIAGDGQDKRIPVKDATFQVKVHKLIPRKEGETPDKQEIRSVEVRPTGEEGQARGIFEKTDEAGEYEVEASAKLANGTTLGPTSARFMVYSDNDELLNNSSNHPLLKKIAMETGGEFKLLRDGGLEQLLQSIKPQESNVTKRTYRLPNWSEPDLGRQLVLYLAFAALICAEWYLRRVWGLV
jgi:uncharacterized membrane protein